MDTSRVIVHVPFNGQIIDVARVEGKNDYLVALKRACENLGIDYSGQLQRLKTQPWATVGVIPTVADDGKEREMACIDRQTLVMWLATIDTARLKSGGPRAEEARQPRGTGLPGPTARGPADAARRQKDMPVSHTSPRDMSECAGNNAPEAPQVRQGPQGDIGRDSRFDKNLLLCNGWNQLGGEDMETAKQRYDRKKLMRVTFALHRENDAEAVERLEEIKRSGGKLSAYAREAVKEKVIRERAQEGQKK